MTKRIKKIWAEVENEKRLTCHEIKSGLASLDSDIRLRALVHIRQRIERGRCLSAFFDLATTCITDSDNDCRWQSVLIVGEYLDDKPEEIWKLIMHYGSSNDSDLRGAIATILLEKYFEHNPKTFYRKISIIGQEIEMGNSAIYDTLETCWFNFKIDSMQSKTISDLLTKKK